MREIGKEVQVGEKQSQAITSNFLAITDEIKVVNGRLVFANQEVFFQTADALSQLSQEEMQAWVQKMGVSSLLFYNLNNVNNPNKQYLADLEISPRYLLLMNLQGEYQIGNYIHWCDKDGMFYFIPNADEKLLKQVKANPKKSNVASKKYIKSTIQVEVPNSDNGNFSTYTVVIPGNTADARYQYQYNYGGHTYKMVFEVASVAFPQMSPNGVFYANYVETNLKLHYLRNGKWADAGETAVRSFNVSYEVTANQGLLEARKYFSGILNGSITSSISLSKRFNENSPVPWNGAVSWTVSINGWYSQTVPVHNNTNYTVSPATW